MKNFWGDRFKRDAPKENQTARVTTKQKSEYRLAAKASNRYSLYKQHAGLFPLKNLFM